MKTMCWGHSRKNSSTIVADFVLVARVTVVFPDDWMIESRVCQQCKTRLSGKNFGHILLSWSMLQLCTGDVQPMASGHAFLKWLNVSVLTIYCQRVPLISKLTGNQFVMCWFRVFNQSCNDKIGWKSHKESAHWDDVFHYDLKNALACR